MTDLYIVFTLKMESVSKNTIFGLKMMVKSGLEKIFLKFFHAGQYFHLLQRSAQNHKFSNKMNYLPTWRDFKIFFSRPLFTIIFRPKMVFLDTDSIFDQLYNLHLGLNTRIQQSKNLGRSLLNTSYLTNLYIGSTLKMESVS